MVEASSEVEERWPRVNLDVDPSQLKGLEVGSKVTVTIVGYIEGYRLDTEDDWGTGASVNIGLKSSDIKTEADSGSDEEAISNFIDD